MSQPTLGTRPATWSGTSNPILYKFTSTNYVQPGYRMVVEIWNATTAAKIADAKYYSDSVGNVIVDVSSFLKANMSLVNNSDLTSVYLYIDNNWINYYIKYQEVWTAASESQVDDVANGRFAIYGGFQIGSNNDYQSYTTGAYSLLSGALNYFVLNTVFTFSLYIASGNSLRVRRYTNTTFLDNTDTITASTGIYRGAFKETGAANRIEVYVINGGGVTVSAVTTYILYEECNIVFVQWKNSLGGDECFPFCCNQEYTFHYSDRKAKRLTLYADSLTLAQWEAIQGLNTIGELYKTPITELTTLVDRTMATVGQSVYVLNPAGTKTGVNVIGSPNTTNTKQKKHSAFVTIEYPELFLQ